MSSVAVNPPKTPVTKGSHGLATATLPNVCKMPGPPAPFVPTPLPNIGQSGKQPDGYSTTVTIEGEAVAIRGASFGSTGDIASKGTGGGIVSNNAEGPTKFIAPGSLSVQIEGKNVQYLGDQMLNNCGPSGSPANAATMMGVMQLPLPVVATAPEQEVACCIHCCDKKKYNLPNNRGGRKTCQRLAHRKHSCVLHRLRHKTASGKLTTNNKFTNVQASPSFNVPGIPRRLIPDTIVNGNKVIDAKFPCDSSQVKFGKSVVNPSTPGVLGTSMLTAKETTDYTQIPGVQDVEAMTPADAQAQTGHNCKC